MKKKLLTWEMAGIPAIILLGVIIHFAFEWTNEFKLTAGLFAVNESVWEHIKLTFIAPLIFALLEYFFIRKKSNNFILAKALNAVGTTLAMLILFYLYTAILGHDKLYIDILIFCIAVIIGQFISYRLLISDELPVYLKYIGIFIIIVMVAIFYIFTFDPPKLPIFKDEKGFYGIKK